MFSSDGNQCITFKTNQRSFDVHRRKFDHDFRVNVFQDNLSGSKGVAIDTMNAILVSKYDTITFYEMDTYRKIDSCQIKIPLLTQAKEEILGIVISEN